MKKECEHCKNNFDAERNKIRFCSTACANKARGRYSQETKDKISKGIKNYYKDGTNLPYNKGKRTTNYIKFECPYCETPVETMPSRNAKTCGKPECIKQHQSKATGGYREGSGRSKSGYYNGVYCGSTYELVWMMYNDAHSISYKRFEGFIEYGDGKRYFPDFIQDKKVIEIKGFHTDVVDIKKSATEAAGYEIEVLYKEDLKPMFEWFKSAHKSKKLVEMYDGHKPKFEYECSCCGKSFGAEKQKKTELKYCSRVCAGKHRNYLKYNN